MGATTPATSSKGVTFVYLQGIFSGYGISFSVLNGTVEEIGTDNCNI